MQSYRIQITIRRKGEPVFLGEELKTDSIDEDELNNQIANWIKDTISEDMEGEVDE